MWNGDISNLEEVALYINSELSKGRTQKDIETNDFKVNQRVIEKKLKRKGYKKINNQYILEDNEYFSNTVVTNEDSDIKAIKDNKYEDSNTIVINNDDINKLNRKQGLEVYEDSITKVITNKKLENNLMDLLINYDKIMKVINQYDKQYEGGYDGPYDNGENRIIIELPIETKKEFRTTIRVNNVIWEQFNEFALKNNEFTKRDLISMALKQYIDQFK